MFKQDDAIAMLNRTRAMGNHDDGYLTPQVVKGFHHRVFGDDIEQTGGIIKDQQTRVSVQGTSNDQSLMLAAGESGTAFSYFLV